MIQDFLPLTEKPRCDCSVVAQTGWVDLSSAFAGAGIAGDLSSVERPFNGIEEPGSIIGRPDDVFAAHRAAAIYSASAASGMGGQSSGPTGGE